MKGNDTIIKILEELLEEAKIARYKIEGVFEQDCDYSEVFIDAIKIPVASRIISDNITFKLHYNYEESLEDELKLEDVCCVAENTSDVLRIYSVKPQLLSRRADLNTDGRYITLINDRIINLSSLAGSIRDEVKVDVEKFIELIKNHK